jgi:alkylation response protein AidB-like acyl-CoA dehydrogenase
METKGNVMAELAETARAAPTPSFAEYMRAAEEMAPLLEAEAEEAERQCHLTDAQAAAQRKAGFYCMLAPRELGGPEVPYIEAMQVVERVSLAYSSAAWCQMVMNVHAAAAGAFLPPEGARIVYDRGPDMPVAGQGVPNGYATPVEGGYRVKGKWSYGSGIWHCEWVHSGCFVMDGDEMKLDAHGHPEIVLVYVPRETVEIDGNWDVHGLRGTGSFDYAMREAELFVPEHLTYKFADPERYRGGTQYEPGFLASASWGHTSWALGIGRRALDELAALARARTDLFGPMHESASFRQHFAEAEAKFRSARAFVYAAWDTISEEFAHGRTGSVEQWADIRLAMWQIHEVNSQITTFAHRAARGASLRPGVLQRCYRDAHAGSQHILLADQILQECGKALLGVHGPGAKWNLLGVQEH